LSNDDPLKRHVLIKCLRPEPKIQEGSFDGQSIIFHELNCFTISLETAYFPSPKRHHYISKTSMGLSSKAVDLDLRMLLSLQSGASVSITS